MKKKNMKTRWNSTSKPNSLELLVEELLLVPAQRLFVASSDVDPLGPKTLAAPWLGALRLQKAL